MDAPAEVVVGRREFLGAGLAGAALLAAGPARAAVGGGPPDILEATVAELQEAMGAGRLTARSLTAQYLARIRDMDQGGPALRAVLEVNPEALAIAGALDEERRRKGPRGPLHGIPVLLKDNLETADRMGTTAGSLALAGAPAPARDATLVRKLRAAGAVVLGKTNLGEWANFRSTHSTNGWTGRGGQTRNPYVLDRNPSGSSSGSAVAVSANLCALAVGTETDGSVVSPSSLCGIVGLKPTLGLLSRAGIIPLAHSQDTAGPMARTVRDTALLLGILAGPDPRDPATEAGRGLADYTAGLEAGALRGARLGVARNWTGQNVHTDRVFDRALALLARQGAILVDPAELAPTRAYEEAEQEVLLYEFKADLDAYLRERGGPGDLAALIAWNEAHRDQEMPFFGQELMIQAQGKGPLTDKAYGEARALCLKGAREGLDAALAAHRLDALVAPTSGPAWVTDLVNGDPPGFCCSTPSAVAGYPHLTVPMGEVFGLPVGLSFLGTAWSEATLLRFGYAFEQAAKARKPPTFRTTLALG
jgi:amidase